MTKNIIIGVWIVALSSFLNAECELYYDIKDRTPLLLEYRECLDKQAEARRRNALSYEERQLEDLEKENRLKQRQIDAKNEKDRLEAELNQEKIIEGKEETTWGKIKSFF